MNNFYFELVNDEDVLNFWEHSPHATIFTHPEVLCHLSAKVDWWMASKGQTPFCLWPVCLPNGNDVGLPEFTYYVGPMWSKDKFDVPAHYWFANSSDVYQGFIKILLEKYNIVHASLPIGLFDIRIFDWWNYHEVDKPRFKILPRYTSIINNLQQLDDNNIVSKFRKRRRTALRKIEKKGPPERTNNWRTNDLIDLYQGIMERQNLCLEKNTIRCINSLVDIINLGHGEIIAYKDYSAKKVIAAQLLLYGKGIANIVLSLVDERYRDSNVTVWMTFNAIKAARDTGQNCIDFNGGNSPNRGDDNHSYGAEPTLYFEIKYPGIDL